MDRLQNQPTVKVLPNADSPHLQTLSLPQQQSQQPQVQQGGGVQQQEQQQVLKQGEASQGYPQQGIAQTTQPQQQHQQGGIEQVQQVNSQQGQGISNQGVHSQLGVQQGQGIINQGAQQGVVEYAPGFSQQHVIYQGVGGVSPQSGNLSLGQTPLDPSSHSQWLLFQQQQQQQQQQGGVQQGYSQGDVQQGIVKQGGVQQGGAPQGIYQLQQGGIQQNQQRVIQQTPQPQQQLQQSGLQQTQQGITLQQGGIQLGFPQGIQQGISNQGSFQQGGAQVQGGFQQGVQGGVQVQGGQAVYAYIPVLLPNGQLAYQLQPQPQIQPQSLYQSQTSFYSSQPQPQIQPQLQSSLYLQPNNNYSPQPFFQQSLLQPTINNNNNYGDKGQQAALFPQQNQILPARTGFLHLPQNNRYNAPHSSTTQKPASWLEIYGSATADDKFILREWFQAVDQDNSGQIDEKELSLALSAAGDKISESTIKLMMKIFDTDNSGTIDYYEFERLFRYIQVTRESFESYDYNRNGTLSLEEAFHAISRAKFDFKDASTMRLLCKKFDKGNRGELTFENFLELVMFLGNWRTVFTMHDADRDGWIKINLEELIMLDLDHGLHR